MAEQQTNGNWQERYRNALLGVFGNPQLCLDHGQGCVVVDNDGKEYLDLLAGIAVNALGYAHPAWVEAVSHQSETLAHVSNFFTTGPQLDLAEKLLALAKAPKGSAVFLSNSGTEANEAAIKICMARKNGRIIAFNHAFHGRTIGALSLTHKIAYRQPFGPSAVDVTFIAPEDPDALASELDRGDVSGVFMEPIQGEAGVVPLSDEYLQQVRELTACHDVLMVVDEVQCGMGRTGRWFAHQSAHITPDVMTMAKALGGGFPIGATMAFGSDVSGILAAGQHGTTFGGNPLACAAALAVISTIESDDLLTYVRQIGTLMSTALRQSHPRITEVRGTGALLGVQFDSDIAADLVAAARHAGFIVNAVNPSTLRLAPPYILTKAEAESFIAALPRLIDAVQA